MKSITALFPLLVILLAACGAATETPDSNAAPPSCELLAAGEWEQVWAFSDHDTAAPVGTACLSLGGGMFTCKPTACLDLAYTGTCPHCGGGGE